MTERIRGYEPDTTPLYPAKDTRRIRIRTPLEIQWRIRSGGIEPFLRGSYSKPPSHADSSYPSKGQPAPQVAGRRATL
jgi:hypothetical protein